MSAGKMIEQITQEIRRKGTIVPRDYQTIGGMWTVDTYVDERFPGVRVQLQDEGYTDVILTDNLNVSWTSVQYRLDFRKGGEEELLALHYEIFGETH